MVSKPSRGDRVWEPAPEARERGTFRSVLVRTAVLLAVVLGGYAILAGLTRVAFTPRLEIVGPHLPDRPIPPTEKARVGVKVRNGRWREGAAYVVAVFQREAGEVEVEGPVTPVPPRTTVPVTVDLTLEPGRHVATFVVFDAWRENVRVGAVHGASFQIGMSDVRLARTDLPSVLRRGETVAATVWATNAGTIAEDAQPLLVLHRADDETAPAVEVYGDGIEIAAGVETAPFPFPAVLPADAPPGRYYGSLILLSSKGERLGKGLYRLPIEIR